MKVSAATCTMQSSMICWHTGAACGIFCFNLATLAATKETVEGCKQLEATWSSFRYQKCPSGPAIALYLLFTVSHIVCSRKLTHKSTTISSSESGPTIVVFELSISAKTVRFLSKKVSCCPEYQKHPSAGCASGTNKTTDCVRTRA